MHNYKHIIDAYQKGENMRTLGYKHGYRYLQDETGDIYRNDYSDPETCGVRFFCTRAAWPTFLRAYGPLIDECGETVKVKIEYC